MSTHRFGNALGPTVPLSQFSHRESIPWREIAVDAGLLALFLLTSSWFARG